MPHLYDGYYINLDRSPDRREKLERQFAALGLSDVYRRFPAVEGAALPPGPKLKPGERGIFRSHFDLLQQAQSARRPIHILEDDAVLSPVTAPALDLLITSGALNGHDIIFTETLVPQDLRALKLFKAMYDKAIDKRGVFDVSRLQVIDLANVRFACTSSYLVNPASAGRILERYQEGWNAGPQLPLDLFLRAEVQAKRLRAGCTFPFVTTIDLGGIVDSTVGRTRSPEYNAAIGGGMVLAILRYSFFVGRDLNLAHKRLAAILAQTVELHPDQHRLLMEKAVGYILSDYFGLY